MNIFRTVITLLLGLAIFASSHTYADELLMPLVSRHTSYHGQSLEHLNERNFGLGYERRNWFGIAFKDSLYNPSGMIGYNFRYQKDIGNDWHISATASTGLMFRKNVRDYTPFPVVLPFIGIGYKDWTAEMTYIPATKFTEQGAAFLMLRVSM
jgi:hypothetical protein